MKYLNLILTVLFSTIIFEWVHTHPLLAQDSSVQIINRDNYYQVTMDYTSGISHYDMGVQLAQKILLEKSDFEQLFDSYIAEIAGSQSGYNTLLSHMEDIKPQMYQAYQDEIDGIASQLSGGNTNGLSDNKLSKDELYILQLLTDVIRSTQCSGISVYGARSQTGHPMTARILDWYDGADNQLAQIQAVTTIKYGSTSICLIGYLGYMGLITGFNSEGVFAGILDSQTGATYSSTNKYSYTTDLRYALENSTTLSELAGYLTNPSRNYAFNHLVLLSNSQTSKVLENNFSGSGTNMRRAVRSDTSALNPGITWGFADAIAVVNSFLLLGNHDNHTGVVENTERWNSFKTQMQNYGETITLDQLRLIASFDNGNGPGSYSTGDIYSSGMQQIVLFQPDILHLEVAFKPKSGILPVDPIFETIPIDISTSVEKDNSSLPKSYDLKQNYPNPFNPSTKISYSILQSNFIILKVYNILGQEIQTLVSKFQTAGDFTVDFNAKNLPSGIYIYKLQVGDKVSETKKMLVMR